MNKKEQTPSAAVLKAAGSAAQHERLTLLAHRCTEAVEAAKGNIAEAFALAACVQELRAAVLPLVPAIRPLVGTALGFRTDRDHSDKGAYTDQVLTDCVVEAIARGLYLTGNEWNIIGGKCYTTKEGYARLVASLPGLTDLELTPGVPKVAEGGGGAVVHYRATWKIDGKPQSLSRDIPTRLNAGMGADAAIGKATRKMLAAIHSRITGSLQSFADSDAEDVEPGARESKVGGLAAKLLGVKSEAKATASGEPGVFDPADDAQLFGNEKAATRMPD